jgi:aminopeptidase N
MIARDEQTPSPIRLADYRPPAWTVSQIELEFDLGIDATEVHSRLHLRRGTASGAPLRLDGEGLELLSITLDGQPLDEHAYRYRDSVLEVDGAGDGSVLETRVRVRPAANTALEGLYLSGARESGFLLTQCEAEGFRHITFFPDRPDVLARYTVTLRADRERFPVLLAGGNPDGSGELPDGRHWARFVDPYPKPCYLFALVAGRLEKIERDYRTADGRDVKLVIWAEADVIGCCHYAMDALERAMRWDEQAYGRNFDLSVFHVVATHDFNMGAMENKGLNIFNAKYLLADPDTTTDDEYRAIEAVIGHEYFHNWSGNRVTCRDWFQLCLKEGLTVYREQEFESDLASRTLRRIEDVATSGARSSARTRVPWRIRCARTATARSTTSTPRRCTRKAPRSCACWRPCLAATASAVGWIAISSATTGVPRRWRTSSPPSARRTIATCRRGSPGTRRPARRNSPCTRATIRCNAAMS